MIALLEAKSRVMYLFNRGKHVHERTVLKQIENGTYLEKQIQAARLDERRKTKAEYAPLIRKHKSQHEADHKEISSLKKAVRKTNTETARANRNEVLWIQSNRDLLETQIQLANATKKLKTIEADNKKLAAQHKIDDEWIKKVGQENLTLRLDNEKQKQQIRQLTKTIDELKDQEADLQETLKEKDEEIAEYQAQCGFAYPETSIEPEVSKPAKDFHNSSLPSSASPNHIKIHNGHKPTGKKPGGQPGHAGHHRPNNIKPTSTVVLPAPKPVLDHPEDWEELSQTIEKDCVGMKIIQICNAFISHMWKNKKTGEIIHSEFPADVNNEMNYDESIKTLFCFLTCLCNVSVRKAQEFIKHASDGLVVPSVGWIQTLKKEFEKKSAPERQKIYDSLIQSKYLHTDLTHIRTEGKTAYIGVTTNGKEVLYHFTPKKGRRAVKNTPVEHYQGTLIHDHDKVLFHYGKNHQKCLAHELRYLKSSMELEPHMSWNKDMHRLLQKQIHLSKTNPAKLLTGADKTEKEYDRIIKKGYEEFGKKVSSYHREGFNTLKRLDAYKDATLYFIRHPDIPATNNTAERALRQIKRKAKQTENFRSKEGARQYANTFSILQTARQKGENPYREMERIFKKPPRPSLQKEKSNPMPLTELPPEERPSLQKNTGNQKDKLVK